MFKQQSKMNKRCSEQLLNDICDNYTELKKYYYSLYFEIVKNKDKNIEEILKDLSKTFNKEYNISTLSKELSVLNSLNTSKAYECSVIINYALAKRRNNEEHIKKYGDMLKKIDERKELNQERSEQIKKAKKHVTLKEAREEKSKKDEILDYMNKVLNDEINTEELDRADINYKNQIIKRYLKEIDPELYIDYLIKIYGVNTIEEIELKQLKETIEHFVKNIKSKIVKIDSLDIENEEDVKELHKINIKGIEELDSTVAQYPKKVYNWKRKRLERLRDSYTDYLKLINKYLDNDFTGFKELSSSDKRIIREDEEFLDEYIKDFRKMYEVYSNGVGSLSTVKDSSLKNIKLIYSNKVIKKDDSKED